MKPSQRRMWTPRSYLWICEVSTLRKGDSLYYYSARITFRENLQHTTFDSLISKSAMSNWPNQESKPAALLVSSAMQDLGGVPAVCCQARLSPGSILHLPPLGCLTLRHLVTSASALGDLRGLLSHTKFRNGTVPARLLPEMGHDQAIKCQGRGNESEGPGIHSVEGLLPRPVVCCLQTCLTYRDFK